MGLWSEGQMKVMLTITGNVGEFIYFGMLNLNCFEAGILKEVILNDDLGAFFSKLWSRAVTPSNIEPGFCAMGIYLFDSNNIPGE
jgi:hypothetical protein